jgi:predicted CoA-binding protein
MIVTELDDVRDILATHKRVAVLGIKPESRSSAAAHYVPAYLAEHGYDIVPVPTYYPDVTEILGRPVVRDLTAIEGEVDIVDVFRKPEDIAEHVDDLIALGPKVVWFQLGIRNDDAARALSDAGIRVVQDRCMLADHRRMF